MSTSGGASVGIRNGTENHQLYSDTVITNRLTQRRSVNVSLMKETIRTLLPRSSEAADLACEDYENNCIRELLMDAYWEITAFLPTLASL